MKVLTDAQLRSLPLSKLITIVYELGIDDAKYYDREMLIDLYRDYIRGR